MLGIPILGYFTLHQLQGTVDSCFGTPDDLDFDEAGNIYVVEHRVQVLTPQGQHIRYIGGYGGGKGELDNPYQYSPQWEISSQHSVKYISIQKV